MQHQRLRVGALLGLAVFMGLVAGLAQVMVMVLKWAMRSHPVDVLGPHMVWMTPVATMALFSVAGLVLAAVGRIVPRLAHPVAAIAVFGFLGVLGISLHIKHIHPAADALLAAGGASVLVRFLQPRLDWFLRVARRVTPWLAAGVGLLAPAMGGAHLLAERLATNRLGEPVARINILLLVLDTVRAQSLGLYGYGRRTAPQLERWAKRGVFFKWALAPSSWTLPSHASMFTGRPPFQLSADWGRPLDDTYPTLAEYLRDRGYLTAGFIANLSYCSRNYGLARGFVHYEDYPVTLGELVASSKVLLEIINSRLVRRLIPYHDFLGRKDAATINRDFLRWLDRRPSRPFFAFLNYFEAHEPVVPRAEFEHLFPSAAARRWDILDHQLHDAPRLRPWSRPSPIEIQAEIDAYDAVIAGLDQRVGELLDQLDRRGLLDSTVVFITSDHGEQHGEHDTFGHGDTPYRLLSQVPLIMLRPDHRTGVVDEFVSLRDLATTALDVAGIANDGRFHGCSFGRLVNATPSPPGSRNPDCSAITTEVPNHGRPWAAASVGRFHFITGGPDRAEWLFDWDADPGELHDLVGDPRYRNVVLQMREMTAPLLDDARRRFWGKHRH